MMLQNETLAFSKELTMEWKDPNEMTAKGLRMSYLYSNALRSAHTADSFWILNAAGKFHDCYILARTLFERMVKGRYAAKSEENFLKLVGGELHEDLENVGKWEDSGSISVGTVRYRDVRKDDVDLVLRLSGRTTLPGKKSLFEMAGAMNKGKELYRAIYRELCLYSHPTFDASLKKSEPVPPYLLLMAYSTPYDTAYQFLRVHGGTVPDVGARYKDMDLRCAIASGLKSQTPKLSDESNKTLHSQ